MFRYQKKNSKTTCKRDCSIRVYLHIHGSLLLFSLCHTCFSCQTSGTSDEVRLHFIKFCHLAAAECNIVPMDIVQYLCKCKCMCILYCI